MQEMSQDDSHSSQLEPDYHNNICPLSINKMYGIINEMYEDAVLENQRIVHKLVFVK